MIAGLSKDKVLPLIGRLVRTKAARPEDTSCDGINATPEANAGHLKVGQLEYLPETQAAEKFSFSKASCCHKHISFFPNTSLPPTMLIISQQTSLFLTNLANPQQTSLCLTNLTTPQQTSLFMTNFITSQQTSLFLKNLMISQKLHYFWPSVPIHNTFQAFWRRITSLNNSMIPRGNEHDFNWRRHRIHRVSTLNKKTFNLSKWTEFDGDRLTDGQNKSEWTIHTRISILSASISSMKIRRFFFLRAARRGESSVYLSIWQGRLDWLAC